jgi:hypothetical protein
MCDQSSNRKALRDSADLLTMNEEPEIACAPYLSAIRHNSVPTVGVESTRDYRPRVSKGHTQRCRHENPYAPQSGQRVAACRAV